MGTSTFWFQNQVDWHRDLDGSGSLLLEVGYANTVVFNFSMEFSALNNDNNVVCIEGWYFSNHL